MNFKEFYNPKHVYEGYFETYFIRPFFHRYVNFSGRESARSCLLSLASWMVVTLGIVGIMMGMVGLVGPEAGASALRTVCIAWGILSVVPIISLVIRTINGSPDKPDSPRLLGIDTMLAVSCILFFVTGILMMTTTLHSGVLNPNAGLVDDTINPILDEEKVIEEPIFTYQDENPTEVVEDTSVSQEDPDYVDPNESYDPTIETPDEESQIISDSL